MGMIQAPDQSRIDQLDLMVQRYEKDLLRLCCMYLRDWNAAEDIVQDTFLKAYKHLDSFRGDSCEKTWLNSLCFLYGNHPHGYYTFWRGQKSHDEEIFLF